MFFDWNYPFPVEEAELASSSLVENSVQVLVKSDAFLKRSGNHLPDIEAKGRPFRPKYRDGLRVAASLGVDLHPHGSGRGFVRGRLVAARSVWI